MRADCGMGRRMRGFKQLTQSGHAPYLAVISSLIRTPFENVFFEQLLPNQTRL